MNVDVRNGLITSSVAVVKDVEIAQKYRMGLYVETGGTLVLTYDDDTVDTVTVGDLTTVQAKVKNVGAASTAAGIHALCYSD